MSGMGTETQVIQAEAFPRSGPNRVGSDRFERTDFVLRQFPGRFTHPCASNGPRSYHAFAAGWGGTTGHAGIVIPTVIAMRAGAVATVSPYAIFGGQARLFRKEADELRVDCDLLAFHATGGSPVAVWPCG